MIARHLATPLVEAARGFPVVSVTGPRQSGKTTLVRAAFPGHAYVSLEDPEHRRFADADPRGFLGQFAGDVILDEVQRAPDLFSYIQGIVDGEDRPGRFVLSGSQNFLLMQRVTQSLAGRCAVLKLLPLSRAELCGAPLTPLTECVQRGPDAALKKPDASANLFETLLAGGYPRIHDKRLAPQQWLANYYQTYLERDVRDLLNVGDIEGFARFVRLCAGRSGQLLNASSLAADAGVSHTTARRWLSLLEASSIVYLLRPHFRNFNKRLIKSPKLYFVDSGLLCYLLRIRTADELTTHAARGAIFESWAVGEALKNYCHRGVEADLYFWRDATGHEIDLLLDEGATQVPIEIKSGQTIAEDFFKDLHYWRKLTGDVDASAALLYGGEQTHVRSGVRVMGWAAWG